MNFHNITQPVLLEYLQKHGYDITRSTILRYVQNGYITAPLRKAKLENPKEPRVYYHPIAVIELMTAILLHKGDFLNPSSRKRIPQFTGESVFLGRVLYFAQNKAIFTDFPFEDFCFQFELEGEEVTVPMDYESVRAFADDAENRFQATFDGCIHHRKVFRACRDYSADMYYATFERLYAVHMKNFLTFANVEL